MQIPIVVVTFVAVAFVVVVVGVGAVAARVATFVVSVAGCTCCLFNALGVN